MSCPFCGADSAPDLIAWDRNREVSDARFAYRRCEACATIFLASPPEDLARYYAADYFDFAPDGVAHWRTSDFLRGVEQFRVDRLRRYVQPGPLIEIGSGAGAVASVARDGGVDVTALEMDARGCEHLRDDVGVTAINSDRPIEALAGLPAVSVVAMWHSFEHLPNPGEVLDVIAEHIEPGGILALGVPNPDSLEFRLLGPRWPHLDAPRHLSLVPASALRDRARTLGFSVVELLTNDPFGRHCNQHGWSAGFARRPARGVSAWARTGGLIATKALAPVEARGLRGAAMLMLLRKDASGRGRD